MSNELPSGKAMWIREVYDLKLKGARCGIFSQVSCQRHAP
jgi:hypothetical protein